MNDLTSVDGVCFQVGAKFLVILGCNIFIENYFYDMQS